MLRSITAGASGMLALLLLVGCAPGSDDPGATEPTAVLSSDRLGVDWHTVEGATRPITDEYLHTVSAGGSLWVIGDDDTLLHATENGVDWRQIDLKEHGLPVDASLLSTPSECPSVGWESRGGLFLVYGVSTRGQHPAGLASHPWVVEINGDDVEVRAGAEIGLETMPAAQGGFDFRIRCVAGIVEIDGRRALIGEGQWWQPYETGSLDGFVAFEDEAGHWAIHSDREAPFFGGSDWLTISRVVALNDRIVALSGRIGAPYAWSSPNGLDWERFTMEGYAETSSRMEAATNGDSLVVTIAAGDYAATSLDVWSTTDGSTWNSHSLLPADSTMDVELLAYGATGYSLIATQWMGADSVDHIWMSTDGVTWTPQPSDDFISVPSSATEHAGGLVGFRLDEVRVSGLDSWRTDLAP